MITHEYYQPVASHRTDSTFLVLRDLHDEWHLWMHGERVSIPSGLASWLLDRPELDVLSEPRFWYEESSLPAPRPVQASH